ncbi:carbonic anhydrase 15-like, partial [Dermacentor silvarum]|uniref:carbonic anhydrase 15-like n=1 Tax=Dermacentor silvarum TaxID=543639 RepID=UPI0021012F46
MLTPEKASKATVSIYGLPSIYNFKQLHFHWGAKSTEGSEHHVDGKSNAMEMHLVHINTEYGSAREAYKHPDGFLVVGVLFKVGRRENRALNSVVTALRQMNNQAARQVKLRRLASLEDLLPRNPSLSYFYRGSLTTPPCAQAVIWAVLKNEERISESQLEVFRHLEAEHTHNNRKVRLLNNFRPSMPLNGRHIYISAEA